MIDAWDATYIDEVLQKLRVLGKHQLFESVTGTYLLKRGMSPCSKVTELRLLAPPCLSLA